MTVDAFLRPFRTQIRWRLISYLLLLVAAVVAIVVFQTFPAWSDEITNSINVGEETFVETRQLQVQSFVDTLDQDVRFLAALDNVNALAVALVAPDSSPEEIDRLTTAVENDFLALAETRNVYDQIRFLDAEGLEIVRIDSDGVISSVRPRDQLTPKGDRSYVIGTVNTPPGEVFVSRLDLNREGTPPTIEGTLEDDTIVPVIRYGVPLYVEDNAGESVLGGMVVTNVFANNLLELVQPNTNDATSYLIDQEGYYLVNSKSPNRVFGFEPGIGLIGGVEGARLQNDFSERISAQILGVEEFTDVRDDVTDIETGENLIHFVRIDPPSADFYWVLINVRDQTQAFQGITDATNAVIVATALALLVTTLVGGLVIQRFTSPITDLSRMTEQVATGDLSLRSPHEHRQDEIGTLSSSLNIMTERLQNTVRTLESRIEDATNNLQALVDVNIQTSTILNLTDLLNASVALIKDRFGVYHAQVYLLAGEDLVLSAGAGYVGRQMVQRRHKISFNDPRSIVARAARDQRTVLEANTRTSEFFLRNPLLPDTVTEVSIPLVARGELLGVLDLQADEINTFDDRLLSVLEVLGAQLASAISNSRLYESASRNSRHEQALNEIASRVQRGSTVEEVLQNAVVELGKALRVPHTAIELELKNNTNGKTSEN